MQLISMITGTFTGTGAEIHISLGIRPKFLFLYTDIPTIGAWIDKHGAAKGISGENTDLTQFAEVATNGITAYNGGTVVAAASHPVVDRDGAALTDGDLSSYGFTVGTESTFNTNEKEIYYVALCDDPVDTANSPDYTDEDP